MALVLAVALLGISPAATGAQGGDCSTPLVQNDARSGRDAGDDRGAAVELPFEDRYTASVAYPHGDALDHEDWFSATWTDEGTHRVMVNVTTNAPSAAYALDRPIGAPYVELDAFAPGASSPTYEGTMSSDGSVHLDFTTDEPGTWHFRVSSAQGPGAPGCQLGEQGGTDAPLQSYRLYWGCHPHCVTATT